MILFGTYKVLEELFANGLVKDPENFILFNLTGLKEGIPILGILPPVNQNNPGMFTDSFEERTSDIALSSFILDNNNIFFEFFSKLMYPLYCGRDVYVVVQEGGIFTSITESVLKFIQQRYGYNCPHILEINDFNYINKDVNFSVTGIYNFDLDKARYLAMGSTQMGIPVGGNDNTADSLDIY